MPSVFTASLHRRKRFRGAEHFPVVVVVLEVVGAGVEHRGHQLLFVGLRLLDDDVALLVEHPGHRVRRREVAAVLLEQMADFAGGAVLVVGEHFDDQRRAARAVGLVLRFLVGHARLLPGAAANRAIDVLARHVVGLGFSDDGPQARIHVGIAAAGARRDRQFLDQAREDLAALRVGRALLVLDGVPLGMP